MDKTCPCCGLPVTASDVERIREEYSDLFEQVDFMGEESLTEAQQVLYQGGVHLECYHSL